MVLSKQNNNTPSNRAKVRGISERERASSRGKQVKYILFYKMKYKKMREKSSNIKLTLCCKFFYDRKKLLEAEKKRLEEEAAKKAETEEKKGERKFHYYFIK